MLQLEPTSERTLLLQIIFLCDGPLTLLGSLLTGAAGTYLAWAGINTAFFVVLIFYFGYTTKTETAVAWFIMLASGFIVICFATPFRAMFDFDGNYDTFMKPRDEYEAAAKLDIQLMLAISNFYSILTNWICKVLLTVDATTLFGLPVEEFLSVQNTWRHGDEPEDPLVTEYIDDPVSLLRMVAAVFFFLAAMFEIALPCVMPLMQLICKCLHGKDGLISNVGFALLGGIAGLFMCSAILKSADQGLGRFLSTLATSVQQATLLIYAKTLQGR